MVIRKRRVAWPAAFVSGMAGWAIVSGCGKPPIAPTEVWIPAPSASSAASPPITAPPQRASTAGMVQLPGDTFEIKLGMMILKTVKVLPFWLDVTEVTADAYRACVRAGKCATRGLRCDEHATYDVSGKGNHPINCVDWEQAEAYCKAQLKRLPTDEEWEWATRGTSRATTFPWGEEDPSLAWICWARYGLGDTEAGTCAVGTFPLGDSPQGLEDLQGNVSEWTSTRDDVATDHILRGGNWSDNVTDFVSAGTSVGRPSSVHDHRIGFRCARSAD